MLGAVHFADAASQIDFCDEGLSRSTVQDCAGGQIEEGTAVQEEMQH